MPYVKRWSMASPGYIVFLVDQSRSTLAGAGIHADGETTIRELIIQEINQLLIDLGHMCRKGDRMLPRIHISLACFGQGTGDGKLLRSGAAQSATIEELWERSEGAERAMGDAIRSVFGLCEAWIAKQPDSPPPVVVNLTTGVPEDCDLQASVNSLLQLASNDGTVLLANRLFSPDGGELLFPAQVGKMRAKGGPPDALYAVSSVIPTSWRHTLYIGRGIETSVGARLFAANREIPLRDMIIQPGAMPALTPEQKQWLDR